jgi:hypothetical protein
MDLLGSVQREGGNFNKTSPNERLYMWFLDYDDNSVSKLFYENFIVASNSIVPNTYR